MYLSLVIVRAVVCALLMYTQGNLDGSQTCFFFLRFGVDDSVIDPVSDSVNDSIDQLCD